MDIEEYRNLGSITERALVMNAELPVARLTQRDLRKQASLVRLLTTAKELFCEKGYEATGVREIVLKIGRSTGVAYQHFSHKPNLFAAILDADLKEYVEDMRAAAKEPGTVVEVLTNFFAVDYRHQAQQIKLVRDKISLWWRGEELTTQHMLNFQNATMFLLERILAHAVLSGELHSRTPRSTLSEMLWDIYISEYQNAAIEDSHLATLARCKSFNIKARIILDQYRIHPTG